MSDLQSMIPMNSDYDPGQVDAGSILWSVLELNKVEEISLELTVDEDQCCGYGNGLEADFKFVPWVKAPLLDEPVLRNRYSLEVGRRAYWNIEGTLYYPGVNVRDLLLFIARERIKQEHTLEPYCKYDDSEELIVTFVSKNRRIWVDKVGD